MLGTAPVQQILTVTSNPQNAANVTFTSIVVSGGNAGDFSLSSICASLVPAASCQVAVTFSPAATGARASAVVFTDSAVGSPQSIPISGTGTQSGISISPASVAFGNQPVGTTSGAQIVTLTNTGTATLNITSINLTGTNPSYFAKTGSCGFTLAPGANCPMSITFTPQPLSARRPP